MPSPSSVCHRQIVPVEFFVDRLGRGSWQELAEPMRSCRLSLGSHCKGLCSQAKFGRRCRLNRTLSHRGYRFLRTCKVCNARHPSPASLSNAGLLYNVRNAQDGPFAMDLRVCSAASRAQGTPLVPASGLDMEIHRELSREDSSHLAKMHE